MMTIGDMKDKAMELRARMEADSINPEDTFGLMWEVIDYIANMEMSDDGLGIHKVYPSVAAMYADGNAPVGSNDKPLRFGQLVAIYNRTNPDDPDNGNVYSWQGPGPFETAAEHWFQMGALGSAYQGESDIVFALIESKADKTYVDGVYNMLNMIKANKGDTYTVTEAEARLATKADIDDVYTKEETDEKIQAVEAGKADAALVATLQEQMSNKADRSNTYTRDQTAALLEPYATKEYVGAVTMTKADKADVQTLQGAVAVIQRDKADKTVVSEEADGLCPQLPDDADKANKFLGGDGQWKIVKSSSFDYIIDSNTTSEEVRDILSQDNVRVLVKNVQNSYSGEVTLGNDVYIEGEGPHLSILGFNRINVRCQEGKTRCNATFNNLYIYSWLNIENSLDVNGNVYLEFTNCYIAKRTDNNHNTIYANDLNAANEPTTRVELKFTGCTLKNSDVDGRAIYLNNIKYSTVTFIGCQVVAPQTPVLISNPNFRGGYFEAYSTAFIFPLDGTNRIVTGDAVNSIVTENCSPDVDAKPEVFRVDDFPKEDEYELGDVVLIARPEIDYTRDENKWMLGYPQGHHFKLVSGIIREVLIRDTGIGETGDITAYTDASELPDLSGFIRLYALNHDYFGMLKYNPDREEGQIFRRDGWFTDCGQVEFIGIHETDVPVWYDVTPIDNDTIIPNPVRYIETIPGTADCSMGSVFVYKPVAETSPSQAGWLHGHTYKKMIVACKKVTLVVGGNTYTRYVLDDIRADSPIRMFTFDTGEFFYDGYLQLNADLTSGRLFTGNITGTFTDFTDTGTTETGENFLDITPRKSDGEFVIEGNNGLTLPKPQRTWTGTYAEWQALSAAEKAKYGGGIVNITDDEAGTPEYYSTEEVKTNKVWIDGKPIYRRVVNFGTFPDNAHKTVPHGISNVENFISITGWAKDPSTDINFNLPFVSPNSDYCVSLIVSGNNIDVQTGRNRTNYTICYTILEYTKTTD